MWSKLFCTAPPLLFNGNAPVKFKQQTEGLFIYLNAIQLNGIDTIIQLN